MINHDTTLLLIGCGNMGSALAKGWRVSLLSANQLILIDPHQHKRTWLESELGVMGYDHLDQLPDDLLVTDICLATKPDNLPDVLGIINARFASSHPLVLSIAAGRPLSFYAAHLWEDANIVRIMPNTPSLIGMGMSACVSNTYVSKAQQNKVTALMDAVGKTAWLADESLMDSVTAISGSGPAYVFYFIECLIDAAVAQGFEINQAKELVIQTVCGAAQLAAMSPEAPSQLRENVTSKGGTTAAALSMMMSDSETGFRRIILDSVLAAKKRSLEISKL